MLSGAKVMALPVDMTKSPRVETFFDSDSNTFSYVVSDPESGKAAIIDSVMDFNYAAGRISFELADLGLRALKGFAEPDEVRAAISAFIDSWV